MLVGLVVQWRMRRRKPLASNPRIGRGRGRVWHTSGVLVENEWWDGERRVKGSMLAAPVATILSKYFAKCFILTKPRLACVRRNGQIYIYV